MLPRSVIERMIPILKKDARRALRMKVTGFPKPYYCAFVLRDIEWFNTWSGSGSVYRRRSDRTRNVYCDLRVGSYKYDQTSDGGLGDNDEERQSVSHITMPIDDRNYDGLRLALWRLTEAKFREALSDYNHKEAQRISTLDPNKRFGSFSKGRKIHSLKFAEPERIDEQKWVKFCKEVSKWMSELPKVSTTYVEYDASQETKIFVNTEGSTIVQHQYEFSLSGTLSYITDQGSNIEQELVINCATQKDLPNMREFKRQLLKKHEQLLQLIKARSIHAFSGPVLLYPMAAGLLFHEALGHRLEGCRLLSSGEGQTFKGQVDKQIVNLDINIRDNPKQKSFGGRKCIGAYDYDDEGAPAKNAELVENGKLKGFLSTRAPLSGRNHLSNGHARNKKFQRPISRMAVTIVEGRKPQPMQRLHELLLREIRRQQKPFGLIVYETAGGETETTSYDFQGFSGEISYATLVFPDGHEEPVRGVNFVGTPLQALNNVIAIADNAELENHYCAAESGVIPVSTISPGVLLSNLELQSKGEELVTPDILPKPKLGSKTR